MWIPIIIIVLAVALAVGPVMWLRPSPRDKRLAQYRARAAQLGMQVSLVNRSYLSAGGEMSGDRQAVAFYRLPWNTDKPAEKQLVRHETYLDWCLVKRRMDHDVHFAGQWDWLSNPPFAHQPLPRLRAFVRDLPDDYLACDSRRQGVGLAWLEKGEVGAVDDVMRRLEELKAVCLAEFSTSVDSTQSSVGEE